jgi:hypothetical protein
MENGEILDEQITASSEYASNHGAVNARLNLRRPGNSHAWVPRTPSGSWLQVDFELQATVSEVVTQGRADVPQWVKSYSLSYSNNGIDFHPYHQNGVVKVNESFFSTGCPKKVSFLSSVRCYYDFGNIIEWFMNDRSIYNSTRYCCCSSEAILNFQWCNNPRLTTKE